MHQHKKLLFLVFLALPFAAGPLFSFFLPPTLTFSDIWGDLTTINGGHGIMWADIDGNGGPDLYLPLNNTSQGDRPDLLMYNVNGSKFNEEGASRGIDDLDGGSHGAVFADLDNNGYFDLVNGSTYESGGVAGEHNNIFQNDGSGNFVDVTPSILMSRNEETRGVLCFDWDGDGDLDIFMVNGYQGSLDNPGERNEVYRNDGSFQFSEITSGALYTCPAGQGAIDTDFDGDGDIDVFAGNRGGQVNVLRNKGDGTFTSISPDSIGLIHNDGDGGDGITTADVDNDGDLDILLCKDNSGKLYTNKGDGTFEFAHLFLNTDGYMGGFADLDNDCDLDLYFAGDSKVYLNNGSGDFTQGATIPVSSILDPRGVAFADIDNDGDVDFAVGAKLTRSHLIRNNYNSGNWLKIKLISPQGQVGAFGAKVMVFDADRNLLGMREAKSNYGYLAQDDAVHHFGLGENLGVDVFVSLADGSWTSITDVSANQTILIDEGDWKDFSEYDVVVDIKANGSDGPVVVSPADTISITISLDPGQRAGLNADWWACGVASSTYYYSYKYPYGWAPGIFRGGLGALSPVSSFEIFNYPFIPGDYTIYFGVDKNTNGVPDGTWVDFVRIRVE